ncbi:hypothetical protein DXG01_000542, partial [Tephrocybe rancida]
QKTQAEKDRDDLAENLKTKEQKISSLKTERAKVQHDLEELRTATTEQADDLQTALTQAAGAAARYEADVQELQRQSTALQDQKTQAEKVRDDLAEKL